MAFITQRMRNCILNVQGVSKGCTLHCSLHPHYSNILKIFRLRSVVLRTEVFRFVLNFLTKAFAQSLDD